MVYPNHGIAWWHAIWHDAWWHAWWHGIANHSENRLPNTESAVYVVYDFNVCHSFTRYTKCYVSRMNPIYGGSLMRLLWTQTKYRHEHYIISSDVSVVYGCNFPAWRALSSISQFRIWNQICHRIRHHPSQHCSSPCRFRLLLRLAALTSSHYLLLDL